MRYKLLGKSGLRVSELCPGTMTLGDDWGWGACGEESRPIYDANTINHATETKGNANSPTLAGRLRLILGMTMMIAGLYFGLFTEVTGYGLGLLCFLASPFVIFTRSM